VESFFVVQLAEVALAISVHCSQLSVVEVELVESVASVVPSGRLPNKPAFEVKQIENWIFFFLILRYG
jgi:hypothetical protein